jgi:small subunit ribosomal protein S3
MGQKVSPISFRTGVTIGWKSRWFAPKSNYGEFLVEDEKIRQFIDKKLNHQPPYAAIASIEVERTREEVKVILKTARPGLVIGPKGAEVDKLKDSLEELTNRRVNINIVEIKNPDLDAKLTSEAIAEQLKRRASFRRAMKQRAEACMQAGAKGVKIQVSGRLGGAEMSRTEQSVLGSVPLHTFEADIDYALTHCFTTYGVIGVKVWIYRGMFGDAPVEADQAAQAAMTRARRRREGKGPGGGGPGGPGGRRDGGRGPRSAEGASRPGGSRLGGMQRAAQAAAAQAAAQARQEKQAQEAPPAPTAAPEAPAAPDANQGEQTKQ